MTTRRALAIDHDFESSTGLVGERLRQRGFEVVEHVVCPDVERPDRPEPFPDHTEFDLVVPMGSIWSVYDTDTIGAWIGDELALLADAHAAGTPVLGICFGGQALAAALGGSVEPAPVTEIGWYTIDGDDNPVGPGPWMEWHHDRFTPPPGARVLATTPDAVQLYTVDRSVGTQFHPEVNVAHVERWLAYADDDYLAAHGVHRRTLLAEVARHENANRDRCFALVDWFLDTIADIPA